MAISKDSDRLVAIVSKETKDALKLLADKENRSLSNYVSNLLEKHVIKNNPYKLNTIDIEKEITVNFDSTTPTPQIDTKNKNS